MSDQPGNPAAADPQESGRIPGSPRIIAIANQKGGVGKTTTAVNLATALSACGRRTLIVDLDPQGNASTGLAISSLQRRLGSYQALVGGASLSAATQPTVVPNMWIVPTTPDLAGAEIELIDLDRREYRLRDALSRAATLEPLPYEFIIIDCPPSLSLLTLNAMVAADCVLVPLQCEFYALEGLSQLMRTIDRVKRSLNPVLEIQGVVLTMYDKRSSLNEQVASDVRAHFGQKVYETEIPRNVRIAEAPSHGKPALLYDIRCAGSQAYVRLAGEVLKREHGLYGRSSARPRVVAKKPHLGRGLSALLGSEEAALEPSAQRNVPIEYLHPGKYQPRGKFDQDELDSLAQSIRENGVLQPILVRPDPGRGGLEIVAGERRWRAAQLAQLHEVPVIERNFDDRETLEIALVENVQRQDLTPIEEAEAYGRLMSEFRYTQEILAEKIGKSRSSIANLLRLRELPAIVRVMLGDGRLSEGHGRALLGALEPEAMAQEIVAKGLNVRQVEDLVKRQKRRPKFRGPKTTAKPTKDADTRALEHDLSLKLGLKVEIEFNGKGGRVVLHYGSLDQLDGVVEKLNS